MGDSSLFEESSEEEEVKFKLLLVKKKKDIDSKDYKKIGMSDIELKVRRLLCDLLFMWIIILNYLGYVV